MKPRLLAVLLILVSLVSGWVMPFRPTIAQAQTGSVIVSVSTSADDVLVRWDSGNWAALTTGGAEQAGYISSAINRSGAGLRFPLAIPNSVNITSAYLQFCAQDSTTGGVVNSKIRGQAIGNASAFSTYADYNSRVRTSAVILWDNIPLWALDSWYNSPDITPVIQEIVNRSDWVSGNAMGIFWDDHDGRSTNTGGAYRTAYSYDNTPSKAPKLVVNYAASGSPPPTLSSIAVTPSVPANLSISSTQQFTATGTYSNGSIASITSQVTWSSSNTNIATISSTGLATGIAVGNTNITASLSGITSPAVNLTVVTAPTPTATVVPYPDYILYQDGTGYHSLRTIDNAIITSSTTDFADMFNRLLSGLTLVHGTTEANTNYYDPVTNKTGYKKGLYIVSTIGGSSALPGGPVTLSTIVIPPIQDAVIDFGRTSINGWAVNGDTLSIDSAMNTKIVIGQINGGANGAGNRIHINPHIAGPDGLIGFTDVDLQVEALLGYGNGINIDAASGIIVHSRISINEVNMVSGNAIWIPQPGMGKLVAGNQVQLNRVNNATSSLNIGASSRVFSNSFLVDYSSHPDYGIGKPIYDGTNGANEIHTLPNTMMYAYGSGTDQTFPSGVANWTTVGNFGTTQIDTLSEFSGSSIFTAKTPGYYQAMAQVATNVPNIAGSIGIAIWKNNTTTAIYQEGMAIGQNQLVVSVSGLVYLNAGENLRVKLWQSSGVSGVIRAWQPTSFQIIRVR